jgi:hypothetical protein
MRVFVVAAAAISLSGGITTSMQGYADRQLPEKPVSRIAADIAGPAPMVSNNRNGPLIFSM